MPILPLKKTHKVLDQTYTPEEGQECFAGSFEQCNDFISKQSDFFMYKVVPLMENEVEIYNKKS